MVSNINFLLTISIDCQEIWLWELINWSPKRKCFDLSSNSLNLLFNKMYRDQFGEFVCGYWDLKGKEARKFFMRRCNFVLFHTKKYTLPKQTLLFWELRELKMFQHKTIMTRKRFHNCITLIIVIAEYIRPNITSRGINRDTIFIAKFVV